MKLLGVVPLFFAAFASQAQQANSALFMRASVAPAPAQAGGNASGGGQTGGISFVTIPSSRLTPILAGAAFFAAGGVPVIQPASSTTPGRGQGVLAVASTTPSPTGPMDPRALQALRNLAATGDRNARQALAVLNAASARTAAASRP